MGCFDRFNKRTFKVLCFQIEGRSIEKWIRVFLKVMKSIVARCLYGLYTILAIWRVVEATQIEVYWLLLLALTPLALETLHTIFFHSGKANKWITPSVFFFLLIAIPCIWLLELELLNDRLAGHTAETPSNETEGALTNFTNENWTLALEQMLIFVLVFSKWIAPKGKMTNQEMSQLLLVTIAAGADILELLETFGESNVSTTRETVYLVLAVWSWSLLQFCFILTTAKQMPKILNEYEFEEVVIGEMKKSSGSSKKRKPSKKIHENGNGTNHNNNNNNTEDHYERQTHDVEHAVDRFEADLEVERLIQGRRCFDCFCCYNEIWGMTMAMMFQDAPFLLTRLVILFHYRVFTHMNIFFTLKNIIVILLLLNRIRVVAQDDRADWNAEMRRVIAQRKQKEAEKRKRLGLPKKTKYRGRSQSKDQAWNGTE